MQRAIFHDALPRLFLVPFQRPQHCPQNEHHRQRIVVDAAGKENEAGVKCHHRQRYIQRHALQPEVPQNAVGSDDDRHGVEQGQRLQGLLSRGIADAEHVFRQPQPQGGDHVMQGRVVELPVSPRIKIRQLVMLQQIGDVAGVVVRVPEFSHIVLPSGNGRIAHVEKFQQKACPQQEQ